MSVTAVVLTLNEEENVLPCLESLAWADQLVVFDSFSSDDTLDRARKAGAKVLQHPFEHYAQQRNAALDLVGGDWIFFVDADERSTPELAEEVQRVTTGGRDEVAWSVPRYNYIFGRLTLGAGWYPDYQVRLVRPTKVHWERPVHEIAIIDGAEGHLENPLVHYNYIDVADFTRRQKKYAEIDAGILFSQGVRPHFYTPYTQFIRHFWLRFVKLRGIRDGLHGLRLSLLTSYYEVVKYRWLTQMCKDEDPKGLQDL